MRSLYEFSHKSSNSAPEKHDSKTWLLANVANQIGSPDLKGLTALEKSAKVSDEKMLAQLSEISKNPIAKESLSVWSNFNNHWLGLAAALSSSSNCNLPIGQDGSCNGLQHISAMVNDARIGKMVNLLSCRTVKGDVYSSFAEQATASLPRKLSVLPQDITIPRSLVKPPIMALPYGLTEVGCIDYIKEMFKNRRVSREVLGEASDARIFSTDQSEILARYLGYQVFHSQDFLGKCMEFSRKLRELVGILANLDIFLAFDFLEPKSNSVRPNLYMSTTSSCNLVQFSCKDYAPTPRISVKRAKQTSLSTIVHMLDSYHMRTIMENLDESDQFFGIHDSTFTTADKVDKINRINRRAFVEIHRDQKVLKSLRENFLRVICEKRKLYKSDVAFWLKNGELEPDTAEVLICEFEAYLEFAENSVKTAFDSFEALRDPEFDLD